VSNGKTKLAVCYWPTAAFGLNAVPRLIFQLVLFHIELANLGV